MKVIDNIRAHVLHHSSVAEKIGKHELARNIASVKQEKNEGKCRKLIEKISAHSKLTSEIKIHCNEGKLNKLLEKQEKYHKITETIRASSETEMTSAQSAQVLNLLTVKLKESSELLETGGIFREGVVAGGLTPQDILAANDTKSLAGKFGEEPGIVVSSAIKTVFSNALTVEDKANIDQLVNKCSDDKKFIPLLDELPDPLRDLISTCQRVVEHSDVNKMTSDNLSIVLSMRLISENASSPDAISSYRDFLNRCIEQQVKVDG